MLLNVTCCCVKRCVFCHVQHSTEAIHVQFNSCRKPGLVYMTQYSSFGVHRVSQNGNIRIFQSLNQNKVACRQTETRILTFHANSLTMTERRTYRNEYVKQMSLSQSYPQDSWRVAQISNKPHWLFDSWYNPDWQNHFSDDNSILKYDVSPKLVETGRKQFLS